MAALLRHDEKSLEKAHWKADREEEEIEEVAWHAGDEMNGTR